MTVKELIIFSVGAAAGGVIGYFIGREKTKKKAFEYAEKRIEDMEKYYNVTDPYAREKEEEKEPVKDEKGQIDKSSIVDMKRGERVPYHKYYDVDQSKLEDPAFSEHPLEQGEPGEEELTPEEEATLQHEQDFDKPPERISLEALGEVPSFYETKTIFYYAYDEAFTDEDENEIPDLMLLFGEEFLNSHFMDDDTPNAYIRNYAFDTIYEIQKVWASYDETR